MASEYKTVGVSIPFKDLEILRLAKAKAQRERRSFSNYVCGLIETDLAADGSWPDASSVPENICADKGVKMPKDLGKAFVQIEPAPVLKTSPKRRK